MCCFLNVFIFQTHLLEFNWFWFEIEVISMQSVTSNSDKYCDPFPSRFYGSRHNKNISVTFGLIYLTVSFLQKSS